MPVTVNQSVRDKWQSIHDRCLDAAEQSSHDPVNAYLVQVFTVTAGIALDKLIQIDKVGLGQRTDLP